MLQLWIAHAAHERLVNQLANPERIWEAWKSLFHSVEQDVGDAKDGSDAAALAGTLKAEKVA